MKDGILIVIVGVFQNSYMSNQVLPIVNIFSLQGLGVMRLGVHKESIRIVRHHTGPGGGRIVKHTHVALEAGVGQALPLGGGTQAQRVDT